MPFVLDDKGVDENFWHLYNDRMRYFKAVCQDFPKTCLIDVFRSFER